MNRRNFLQGILTAITAWLSSTAVGLFSVPGAAAYNFPSVADALTASDLVEFPPDVRDKINALGVTSAMVVGMSDGRLFRYQRSEHGLIQWTELPQTEARVLFIQVDGAG